MNKMNLRHYDSNWFFALWYDFNWKQDKLNETLRNFNEQYIPVVDAAILREENVKFWKKKYFYSITEEARTALLIGDKYLEKNGQ